MYIDKKYNNAKRWAHNIIALRTIWLYARWVQRKNTYVRTHSSYSSVVRNYFFMTVPYVVVYIFVTYIEFFFIIHPLLLCPFFLVIVYSSFAHTYIRLYCGRIPTINLQQYNNLHARHLWQRMREFVFERIRAIELNITYAYIV